MQHTDHVALLQPGVPVSGGAWADFGAGTGAFTLALAELLGPGSTIYAVDRDSSALRQLKRSVTGRYPGVEMHERPADFTRPLQPPLPPLDGAVMANALHDVPHPDKLAVVRRLHGCLRPGGRLLLVEYNVDRGNPWVPHPLTFHQWQILAARAGFTHTRLLAARPSSFLKEFFSSESVK